MRFPLPRQRIVAIVDRSGSMRPIAEEVVAAHNEFITSQRHTAPGGLTRVLFSSMCEVDAIDVDINDKCALLDIDAYAPSGKTALFDAIGVGIELGSRANEPVIVFVVTDGFDNMSKTYGRNSLKALIDECKEAGWKFFFMGGGDVDAQRDQAREIGIDDYEGFEMNAGSLRSASRTISERISAARSGSE